MKHRLKLGILLLALAATGCASRAPRSDRWEKPSEGATKIVATSLNSTSGASSAWIRIRSLSPDLIIFAGDEALPSGHRQLKENSEFKVLLESTPTISTWSSNAPIDQEDFLNFWKEPKNSLRRTRPGVYDASSVGTPGTNLQVVVLDTKTFRTKRSLLGKDQWDWLQEQLQEPADVRIVVSDQPLFQSRKSFWREFPRELRRLKNLLAQASGRVLILSQAPSTPGQLIRQKHAGKWLIEMSNPGLEDSSKGPSEFGYLSIDWKKNKIRLERRDNAQGTATSIMEVPLAANRPIIR